MTVRSADRTLGIFEAFEKEGRPMPLSQIAEQVGVPISSCHGLIGTLMARGYLYSMARTREFYPTRRLFDVATTIVAHDPFLERIRPLLADLRDRTGETVIVGKWQGEQVLYLDVIEGLHTIRYTARPGEYKPLHSSSIGKSLLGTLTQKELKKWLEQHETPGITEATLTDTKTLIADIERSRERGFFVTRGENVPDVTAVAVPLRINEQWIGIAIAGPSHRMTSRIDELGRELVAVESSWAGTSS